MTGRRLLATLGALVVWSTGVAAPAPAATAARSGWWTSAPALTTSDVPTDGMLVQGGIDDPVAYAAVAFDLADGEQPVTLELHVVPDSVTTVEPGLVLCPLVEPFAEAHGAPIEDGPAYTCDDGAGITGTATEDGAAFSFPLESLPSGTPIAMAVTPSAAVDRVVLHKPGADALITTVATGSTTSTTTTTAPPTSIDSSDPSTNVAIPPPPSSFTPPPAPTGAPTVTITTPDTTPEPAPDTPAGRAAELGELASAPVLPDPVDIGEEGSTAGRLAFFAVLAAAISLWAYAGRRRIERTAATA